jgi:hypothetical protein
MQTRTPLDLRFQTFARAPQGRRNCAVPRQQPNLDLNSGDRGAEVVAIAAASGRFDALAAEGWDVPQLGPVLWTDERSYILGVIR